MANSQLPFILHVDDAPDDLDAWRAEVNAGGLAHLEVMHPNDVTKEDLERAHLVLVDVKLDSWPERDALPALALKPMNGLALLTILQEHSHEIRGANPCAFALYTGHVEDVARGLVPRGYIVARAHNIEWIFDKAADSGYRVAGVSRLAAAVD